MTRAQRDAYYPTLRRIGQAAEFFNTFYARRYVASALFGDEAEPIYFGIWEQLSTVLAHANGLILQGHPDRLTDSALQFRERAESVIYAGYGDRDPVEPLVDRLVEAAETIFRPALIESF